jgi:hypothetical protein
VKKFIQQLTLSLALVAPFAASAGGITPGIINEMIATDTGYVYIRTTGTTTGQPGCAAANAGRFVVNANTNAGASVAARLSFAYALGRSVVIQGTNACGISGVDESLSFVVIYP